MQLFYPLGLPSENIGIHGFHDTTKNQPQSYIPITGCVLSHILSCSRLSSLEKMYFILADSLICINSSKGRNRSIALPATSWAERLSCSKSKVFILQKSLEDKGYFIIYRDKNDQGQNNRNTITTTIPDHVFSDLKYEPDRFNLNSDSDIETQSTNHSQSDNLDSIDKTFIPTLEGKRQHLAKTKMFIRVPYKFLKELNSNCNISATSKVVLLHLFTKMYKSSVCKYDYNCFGSRYDYGNAVDYLTQNSNSIVTSYQELQQELKLHRNSLTKALQTLETANLIKRGQIVIKNDNYYNSRADKSLWRISLVNALRITNDSTLHEQKGQIGYDEQEERFDKTQLLISTSNTTIRTNDQKNDTGKNRVRESFSEKGCTKHDPPCTDSGQLYIKYFIVNNNINKNIDYIDVKSEEEFLENELCSFPSESYNNSFKSSIKAKPSCSNTTSESAARTIKNTSEYKELRNFYPLSEQDVDTLNFRAGREFSNNFMNQLLLKLYIKYPEKRFKNKFSFLSYMEKILKNEKHQGPLVNHTTFRFSCNIGAIEKNLLEYEKYLNQIESSFDTSKDMQIRKKIAGRFSTNVAYEILKEVEFKTNNDNSFILALVPNQLALSERQIATLSEQLEAVYGINGYYVTVLEGDVNPEDVEYAERSRGKKEIAIGVNNEMIYPKTAVFDNVENDTPIDIPASNSVVNTTNENTVWNQIRKGLREELGEAVDETWFSKAEAKECKETKTLTLTMPTRFMSDWVRNNYSHVIRGLSEGYKINYKFKEVFKCHY
ncbi:unknown (plasmid) [Rickettsia felis URRWXCal2]|uniref:DnaA N-terminal domain-containing protein n=1 Tax=Rickettsia felis (strain ATCC VR-1525 / URRWXCal2) TaxID=315456 RepID=Q4UJD3_RICFE|nr:unknown [Rickettsia felis URRWXCal2]AAY62324.1 unknown [Rickettsia felis URRWXCal2]